MKLRNNFKRFISVSAVIAVLLSSLSILPTVNAADAGVIKDDFSSASYTESVWTAVDTETKAESGVTAENGLLKTAHGTKTVTTVNDTNWNEMTVTENRRLESFRSYVTPKQGGEIGIASPVLYFNPNTGDYVYLLLYKHNNYGWQISYGLNGSGRKNNNMLYGGQAYLKETTNMIFEANYNYSEGDTVADNILLALNGINVADTKTWGTKVVARVFVEYTVGDKTVPVYSVNADNGVAKPSNTDGVDQNGVCIRNVNGMLKALAAALYGNKDTKGDTLGLKVGDNVTYEGKKLSDNSDMLNSINTNISGLDRTEVFNFLCAYRKAF